MIPVVRLQLLLIRLETVRVVRLDHPLERRRCVRQDVRTGFRHRQVRRYSILSQVCVLDTGTGMSE